jgi:hypothetical protein
MRIRNWSKLSSSDLWAAWLAEFSSQAEAEAVAIWIANRLVKRAARSTRRRFYEVKEMFLRRYSHSLIEGHIARVDRQKCRACMGTGKDDGFECERCDGTGIWSERTLYSHFLVIAGTRYSFHSYTEPKTISNLPGEDKEIYGGSFTEAEIAALKLPLSGLVRMLRWAAFNGWPRLVGSAREVSSPVQRRVEIDSCPCAAWPKREAGAHHDYCPHRLSA